MRGRDFLLFQAADQPIVQPYPDCMTAEQHVVVLGSSFAAGPGIEPILNEAARRSGRNYGTLVAEKLGARLTDLSVSGATTDNILHTAQKTSWNPFAPPFPPQIESLPSDATIVLVTAGGNNLGYSAGSIKAAFVAYLKQRSYLTWPLGYALGYGTAIPTIGQQEIEGAVKGLVDVVQAVRVKAPAARILLVDYLTVFSESSTPENAQVPLALEEMQALRSIGLQLDNAFAQSATSSGATLVKASTLSARHGIGTEDPWVTGFSRTVIPFHPNAKGMEMVAKEILRVMQGEQA